MMDLHITFRGIDSSESVEAKIRRRAEDLEQVWDRITRCRVVVEPMSRGHRHGNLYRVHIDLAVPGGTVVANREAGDHHAHEDVHVAVRDAFDAARRRLQDHMRKLDGVVKPHDAPMRARVAGLRPDLDHGFLDGGTEGDIYFHRNAVKGPGFNSLKVGDLVRYVLDPRPAERGAHASAVFPG